MDIPKGGSQFPGVLKGALPLHHQACQSRGGRRVDIARRSPPAMEQQLPVHGNLGVSNSGQCPPVHSNLAVPGSGQRIREPPVSLGGRCPTRLYGMRENSTCAANNGARRARMQHGSIR